MKETAASPILIENGIHRLRIHRNGSIIFSDEQNKITACIFSNIGDFVSSKKFATKIKNETMHSDTLFRIARDFVNWIQFPLVPEKVKIIAIFPEIYPWIEKIYNDWHGGTVATDKIR